MTNFGPGGGPGPGPQAGPPPGGFGPGPAPKYGQGTAPYGLPPSVTAQYGLPSGAPQYGSAQYGSAHPQDTVAGAWSGGPPPGWVPPPGHAPPRRRRRGPIIAAVVAVIALAAGAVTVITLLNGRGGAGSAAEAVTLLASDLTSGNYVSAYSRLHPAEADLVGDVGQLVTDELKRLEVFRPDANLNSGYGSVTVSDLRFDEAAADEVRPDVVINKLVAGRVTITPDPAKLPFTDSFMKLAFPDGLPVASEPTVIDIADIVAEQGEPLRLASVRVDGRWYVSLLYTAADYALRNEGLSWPQTSIPASGGNSPEDALEQTVRAALDGNVRRLIELAPPQELQVLHDVGDVIVSESRTSRSGAKLIDLETTQTQLRGDTALTITKLVVESPDGERLTVTRDGDCVDFVGLERRSQRLCGADDFLRQSDVNLDNPTAQRLLPQIVRAVLDLEVVVLESGGTYYVSPSRTLIGFYADVLEALQPEDIRDLLRGRR